MDYTNWWPRQPDNAKGNEDCVMKSLQNSVNYSASTIGWDDYPCDLDKFREFSIYALCMN